MLRKIPGIFVLLLLTITAAKAQTGSITGTVLDDQTQQPLPYASVYINFTTIGTYSDDKGAFALSNFASGDYELIVSFVGREPYRSKVTITNNNEVKLTIRLKLIALKEVQITASKDKEWEKQLEKFKKLFIGTGANAKLCRIVNPWSLSFEETKTGTFSAKASDVLEIENLSLGYRVSYELKRFEVNKNNYVLAGYVRFQEMKTPDSITTMKWDEGRNEAYRGSVQHLIKTIVEKGYKEEGYDLFEDRSGLTQIVRTERLNANVDKTIFHYSMDGKVRDGKNPETYIIQWPRRLEVHYRNKNLHSKIYTDVPYPVSWIEVKGGYLLVRQDGFVLNPLQMTVSGHMFESRIADILPNDFRPEIEILQIQNPTETKPLSALAHLVERPYLHTDKSYYYPNEMIWFEGYMNYFNPMLQDSLSHVLHVDLINDSGKIVLAKAFPIDKRHATGSISVPSLLPSGDYTLRAYTRWMLNFEPELMFVKPIKVLSLDELARVSVTNISESTSGDVLIISDKEQYNLRDKITLGINIKDDFDLNVPANLSISVTDMDQVVRAPDETTILTGFQIPKFAILDTLDKTKRYRIQNGFDLQGTFRTLKGELVQGLVTFVQEEENQAFVFSTEEDGSFEVPNLLLYDSSKLSYFGKTLKGKVGTVVLDSMSITPPKRLAEPLKVEIYKPEKSTRHFIPEYSAQTTVLEEVTVTSSRVERKSTSTLIADYVVNGDWLVERNFADVLIGLQVKVPGFKVFIVNENGFPRKIISFGMPSSFGGPKSMEPLVLIDQVAVNDLPGGPVAQIEMLNPREIESVEVSRFGGGAAFGARGGNGVIAIHTRSRQSNAGNPGTNSYEKSLLMPYRSTGFSTAKKFESPDYSDPYKSSTVPDHRSTVYWNPSVSIDARNPVDISFYAADLVTKYRIVVEGLTSDGKPVRGEKIITITKLP